MKQGLICPSCKVSLDDDSWICDQCGQQLYVCPRCGNLRKGKVCTQDGATLMPLKDASANSSAGSTAPEASLGMSRSSASAYGSSGSSGLVPNDNGVPRQSPAASQPQVKREQQELLLINKNLGLNLVIRPGDVVGRSEGRLSHALQNYKTISRRHCLFNYESGRGWSVTDLGSTNGVKYENKLLAPYQPHPLRPRSFLVIGNVEFFVEIPAENDPDQTWRVGSI